MPKGKTAAPLTDEEKAAKKVARDAERTQAFYNVAPGRVDKALDAIARIGNCASPNYLYTPAQVQRMYDTVIKQVNATFTLFQPKSAQKGNGFTFDEPAASPPADDPAPDQAPSANTDASASGGA